MWTAHLGTEVIDLEAMTATDKLTLRAQHRADPYTCRGCGGRVHTRLNPIDADADTCDPFLTFAHHPHEAEKCRALGLGWDETPEHHQLKSRLARAARKAGWTTELEVQPNPTCRADVVATSPRGNQWALEAQLATLHLDQAVARHDRYTTEFSACTWVHTRTREWANRIPSLRITTPDLTPDDDRNGDPSYFAPDGNPWCRFGAGSRCLNGDRCLNLNHRRLGNP